MRGRLWGEAIMTKRLWAVYLELYSATSQMIDSDDRIICDHVRKAQDDLLAVIKDLEYQQASEYTTGITAEERRVILAGV
jgi:hypothetical protein